MQFDNVLITRVFGLFLRLQRDEHILLDSLIPFDPQIKPHIETYRTSSNALAGALRARGVQEFGYSHIEAVTTKAEFQDWAKHVSNGTTPGLLDYVAATDKALFPFLKDHVQNLTGLCDYVKSRFN